MKAIILAGGRGTRLRPLSRRNYPKQFLKIGGEMSLLQATARRLLKAMAPTDIVTMTNEDYEFHVRDDLQEIVGESVGERIVLEPCARNTAPALALAALFCRDRLGCGEEEVIFVSPSDHEIRPDGKFVQCVRRAERAAAAGRIVTFGIKPLGPETGYGYLKAGESVGRGCFRVARFTEKPNKRRAQRYLREGGYFWNSGMFAFQVGTFLEEIARHAPEIHALCEEGYDAALARFAEMPEISIDYAVMEKSDRVVALPMDLYWNDVGSWDAFFDVMERDGHGNLRIGDVLPVETEESLIMADNRLIATVGLRDVLVVETGDAVLIAKRGDAQRVKKVVDRLERDGRRESREHLTTYRPWGRYTVLERGEEYQIRRVVVHPGESLALQMHHHRSEHWVVLRGTALVIKRGRRSYVHENESVYIPKSVPHRLENPGSVPLEMIEVQNGPYIGEDDVVVIHDVVKKSGPKKRPPAAKGKSKSKSKPSPSRRPRK